MTPDDADVHPDYQALIDCLTECGMTAVRIDPPAAAEAAPAADGANAPAGRRAGPPQRNGMVLVYSMVIMIALLGMASLAVDYGHAQLARAEVQRAADLAARAGARQLSTSTDPAVATAAAITAAVTIAADNPSDDQPLVLAPTDVQVGNWDDAQSPTFSTARLPLNAVVVAVRRDGTVNPCVPLTLAPLVGAQAVAVRATATARVQPPPSPYGLVGIDSVTFGSLGVVATVTGDLASNGPVHVGTPLGIGVSVSGNAQSYNASVARGTAAHVGGVTTPLSAALAYPDVAVPAGNNNARIAPYLNGVNDFTAIAGGTVPAGTYVVHDLNVLAGVAVNVAGPVVFYVTGSLNLAAGVNLLGSANTDPANFTVNVVRGGGVNFLANLLTPLAMVIYAPGSDVTIAVGVNRFTGTIVGKTLDVALPVLGSFVEVKPTVTRATVTTEG